MITLLLIAAVVSILLALILLAHRNWKFVQNPMSPPSPPRRTLDGL